MWLPSQVNAIVLATSSSSPASKPTLLFNIIFPVSQTLHHSVSKSSHSLGITKGWSSVQVQACPIDPLLLKTASPFFSLPFLF